VGGGVDGVDGVDGAGVCVGVRLFLKGSFLSRVVSAVHSPNSRRVVPVHAACCNPWTSLRCLLLRQIMAGRAPDVTRRSESVGQFLRSAQYHGPRLLPEFLDDMDGLTFEALDLTEAGDKRLLFNDDNSLRPVLLKGVV
jgi:hypothetical protein